MISSCFHSAFIDGHIIENMDLILIAHESVEKMLMAHHNLHQTHMSKLSILEKARANQNPSNQTPAVGSVTLVAFLLTVPNKRKDRGHHFCAYPRAGILHQTLF